jgi:acid phosphatase type 7
LRLFPRLFLCLAIVLPGLSRAATVVRGPFLQQTDSDSTVVVVKTDVAAAVRVVAEPPNRAPIVGESSGAQHVVRLESLPAATSIPYRVEVDGVAAKTGTIRTPGAPNTAAGRRAVFGVIGDYGTKGPAEHGNVARLVARGVDALLTVGDNSYPDGAAAEWDATVFGPLAPLLPNTTFWPVAGDHEYRTAWSQPYLDAFELPEGPQGERYYAFDWGDLHVVAIDTNCITPVDPNTQGCDATTMLAWLRADLAASKAPWTAAILHRPALATGHYGVYPQIQSALVPIFEEYGVDIVFQGHNHLYERTWPTRGGKPVAKDYDHRAAPVYVTAGGGGDWLYDFALPAAEWTAYREKNYQHLVVTLDGGSLKVESVLLDGTVHDAFTIVKDVPALPPCSGASCGVAPGDPPPEEPEEPAFGLGGQGCASAGAVPGLLALSALALVRVVRRRRKR